MLPHECVKLSDYRKRLGLLARVIDQQILRFWTLFLRSVAKNFVNFEMLHCGYRNLRKHWLRLQKITGNIAPINLPHLFLIKPTRMHIGALAVSTDYRSLLVYSRRHDSTLYSFLIFAHIASLLLKLLRKMRLPCLGDDPSRHDRPLVLRHGYYLVIATIICQVIFLVLHINLAERVVNLRLQ